MTIKFIEVNIINPFYINMILKNEYAIYVYIRMYFNMEKYHSNLHVGKLVFNYYLYICGIDVVVVVLLSTHSHGPC